MEQPDRHQQELALLHNISRIVDQSIDMRSVVHPVLEALATTLGFRMATITLLRKGGDDILIEAAYGLTRMQAQLGRYKLGEGVTGKVVLTGEPMIIPRTSESRIFLNRTQLGHGLHLRADQGEAGGGGGSERLSAPRPRRAVAGGRAASRGRGLDAGARRAVAP